jgi:integrase
MAVQILLWTRMRVDELRNLSVDDFEDDGDASFLKIRRGKGAKFRRAPVSQRLRREVHRYLNRARSQSGSQALLLLSDGRPVSLSAVGSLFRRMKVDLGFPLHAHKFRHTFATRYIENGGDIERLRKILGHSSYAMILR